MSERSDNETTAADGACDAGFQDAIHNDTLAPGFSSAKGNNCDESQHSAGSSAITGLVDSSKSSYLYASVESAEAPFDEEDAEFPEDGDGSSGAGSRKKGCWENFNCLCFVKDDAFSKTSVPTNRVIRFFKEPELRETISDNNAVNELFYDIVFSLALASARTEFIDSFLACPSTDHSCSTGEKLWVFVLMFGQFWFHAFQLVLYTNRFTTEEFSYNIALYLHMASNVIMAVNGSACTKTDIEGQQLCMSVFDAPTSQLSAFRIFGVGSALAQALTAVQFFRVSRIYSARAWCYTYGFGNAINCLVWIVGIFAARSVSSRIMIGSFSLGIYVIVELFAKRREVFLNTLLPSHFALRMRKFAIVMLTQLLSGVIQPRFEYPADIWIFLAGSLFLAFLFKILYFDFDQVR
eukprot:gb/GECG01012731.1/.p1 GENE.gb/GECG01012731.1/~~gb/GECG01012731.1/.p1  ORF type:complete len:408 (+),score=38.92 gb/GECG01012731.1/:1-1224(+)